MPTSVKITVFSEQDLDSFIRIRAQALRKYPLHFGADLDQELGYSKKQWLARLHSENAETYLAWNEHQLVGIVCIYFINNPKVCHTAHIASMYVSAEYRRQQVASKLLKACLDWATRTNKCQVKLSATSTNKAAIALYQKHGFKRYGNDPKSIRFQGEYMDEILMVKKLPNIAH